MASALKVGFTSLYRGNLLLNSTGAKTTHPTHCLSKDESNLLPPSPFRCVSNNHTRRTGLQLRLGHLNDNRWASFCSAFMKLLLSHIESLLQYHGRRESFRDIHLISVQIKASVGDHLPGTQPGGAHRPLKRHHDECCPLTVLKEALHMPFASPHQPLEIRT